MFCRSCGAEVNNNAKFCPNCGSKRIDIDAVGNAVAKEDKQSTGKSLLTVVIVIILLSVGVRILIEVADRGALLDTPLYDTSTLQVRVESTHIIYGANYEVFIDGDSIDEFRLEPGMYYEGTYKFGILRSEPDRYVEVKVISTGGGLGAQADSKSVFIGTGVDYAILLRA